MFCQAIVSGTQSEFRNSFDSWPVGYVGECHCLLLLLCLDSEFIDRRKPIPEVSKFEWSGVDFSGISCHIRVGPSGKIRILMMPEHRSRSGCACDGTRWEYLYTPLYGRLLSGVPATKGPVQ
nr:hypothetical protein HmN_000477000 [Hymenolepis microstoma]